MNRASLYILYTSIGAISYWGLDILVQWARPPDPVWILLLTFFVPAVSIGTWIFLSRREPYSRYRIGLPFFMLFGIWLIGPLAIALGGIPNGAKFFKPENLSAFLSLWAMFPMTTFMMSTYSGSLGGLLLVTLILVAVAIAAAVRGKTSNYSLQGRRPR